MKEEEKKAGAYHEKIAGSRKDILVYQTEALTQPITIAGPVEATAIGNLLVQAKACGHSACCSEPLVNYNPE